MADSTWLTVEEVLEILDVSPHTWHKWRKRRVSPPMRRLPNGKLRIRRTDLDAWLDERDVA